MPSVEADRNVQGVVHRLHELLVSAVRERRGEDSLRAPVTVAEIYQDLVPYRNVRSALGLDMNADYEHTLLRLLSGEGGLARIEPATAREQIARELESPNPNVVLYRKFAGCDVLLQPSAGPSPAWVEQTLSDEEELPLLEEVTDEPADAVEEGWRTLSTITEDPGETTSLFDAAEAEPEPPVAERSAPAMAEAAPVGSEADVASGTAPRATPVSARCAFCDSSLPRGRAVRYCPYCGADQAQHPCGSCGEAVESDWAFCVACGEPQSA